MVEGFTKKYNLHKLVYYEILEDITNAIQREKQIKGWLRSKKISLIEKINSNWIDLYPTIV
jgi:putative endonuclease